MFFYSRTAIQNICGQPVSANQFAHEISVSVSTLSYSSIRIRHIYFHANTTTDLKERV